MRKLTNEEWENCFLLLEKEFDRIKTELDSFLKENQDWKAKLELSNYPPAIDMAFWLKPETRHKRGTMQLDNHTGERGARIKEEEMHYPANFMGKVLTPFLKAVMTPLFARQNLKSTYILKYRIGPNYGRIITTLEIIKASE